VTRGQTSIQASNLIADDEPGLGNKIYIYRCPVFRTTNRLLSNEFSSDNNPVTYLDLPSRFHPRRWVKRSVALLLESSR